MRTQIEIEDQVRSLLAAELARRVLAAQALLPGLCVHNHRQTLDTRRQVHGEPNEHYNRVADHRGLPVLQTIGLCMLGADDPESWQGTICEDPSDAQRCPTFRLKTSVEDAEDDFRTQMQDDEWVRRNLPEVYSYLWMLGTIQVPEAPPEAPPEPQFIRRKPEPDYPPELLPKPEDLSWWRRLILRWLLGPRQIRVYTLPVPIYDL